MFRVNFASYSILTTILFAYIFVLVQDENSYTFFEPELAVEPIGSSRVKAADVMKTSSDRRLTGKSLGNKGGSRTSHGRSRRLLSGSSDRRTSSNHNLHGVPRFPQDITTWSECAGTSNRVGAWLTNMNATEAKS